LKRVGIGIIGTGAIGTWGHFPGYLEIPDRARVVALCDKNPSSTARILDKVDAKTYTDYRELLKDPSVDAVDICLPHYLHGRVAVAALEAGKHVIVEKPFATTLADADAAVSAARKTGLKLMVAENMRFVKAYEVARQYLDRGAIGDICYARGYTGGSEVQHLMEPNNWYAKSSESGGGVMLDSGVHIFYLFRWLVGEMKSVYCVTTRFLSNLPTDVEDNAAGVVRFANGATGTFAFSNTTESPWTETLELYGTKGSIIVDFLSAQPVRVFSTDRRSKDQKEWWGMYGDVAWEAPYIEHTSMSWVTSSMRREVQHFVNCILEDKQPLVTGEDGRNAVAVALACYESARLARELSLH
jgi:predicted dehydrogenase